jgi:hypothetical protein
MAHDRWVDSKKRKAEEKWHAADAGAQGNSTSAPSVGPEIPKGASCAKASSACWLGIWTPEKAILRDYINATIGFDELSRRTKRPAKSLMRMLGPSGNPQARNLLEVINRLQKAEGLRFEVSLRAASWGPVDARCTHQSRRVDYGDFSSRSASINAERGKSCWRRLA